MSDVEVTPQDVLDLLKSSAASPTVTVQLPAEFAGELKSKAEEPAKFQRTSIPIEHPLTAGQNPMTEFMHWTLQLPDIGPVRVEEDEKALYLKTLLTEEPLELDVSVGTRYTARLRSRTLFEQNAIKVAVTAACKDGQLDDFVSYTQYYCTAVMLLRAGGKDFPTLDLSTAGKSLDKAAALIRQHSEDYVEPMHATRWQFTINCLRIFECKLKLCNDNIHNDSFWVPAS